MLFNVNIYLKLYRNNNFIIHNFKIQSIEIDTFDINLSKYNYHLSKYLVC